VLLGWLVAMPTRQIGHFFFESKDYDTANRATHSHKEAIRVGYNLRRKVVLMSIWLLSPLMLVFDPTLLGMLHADAGWYAFATNVSVVWLAVGVGALLFRTLPLVIQQTTQTGLVWLVKILTDPFHDVMIYHRAPIYVWRGELFDPIVTDAVS
jgi:hypothetical protein